MDSYLSELIVTDVRAVNRLNNPGGTLGKNTDRARFAVTVKRQGLTVYDDGTRAFRSDPAHVCVLPKGLTYLFRCKEPGPCLMVEFDAECPVPSPGILEIPVAEHESFLQAALSVERALSAPGRSRRPEALAGVYRLLSLLCEAENAPYVDPAKRALLEPALAYIGEHPGHVSNEALAEKCGISCVYFRKLFTELLHVSPSRYVQKLNVERAKGQLMGDFGSIGDVAESCGFSDIHHFSRVFKAVTGQTPTDFARRAHHGETE